MLVSPWPKSHVQKQEPHENSKKYSGLSYSYRIEQDAQHDKIAQIDHHKFSTLQKTPSKYKNKFARTNNQNQGSNKFYADGSPSIRINHSNNQSGNKIFDEVGSRLKGNIQLIDMATKSRIQRSKSRRKDRFQPNSLDTVQEKSEKKDLINKIALKLQSSAIHDNLTQSKHSQIKDFYCQKDASMIDHSKQSVARNLKSFYPQAENIQTAESVLKMELSKCQNLLDSIKQKEEESKSILQRFKNNYIDYQQKKNIDNLKNGVRSVESFNIDSARHHNHLNQSSYEWRAMQHEETCNYQREQSYHYHKYFDVKTSYGIKNGYIYPKYVKPCNLQLKFNCTHTYKSQFPQKSWSPSPPNHRSRKQQRSISSKNHVQYKGMASVPHLPIHQKQNAAPVNLTSRSSNKKFRTNYSNRRITEQKQNM